MVSMETILYNKKLVKGSRAARKLIELSTDNIWAQTIYVYNIVAN